MFKSRMFNIVSAIAFFAVAVVMIMAAAFIYDHADSPPTVSPKSLPQVTTAPPSTAQKQAQAPRATQQEAKKAQRDSSPSLMKTASHWLNKTFGLHLLKEETKSMISLLCAVIGSVFSFRTFLLNRRRTQLLEESLKQRST